MKIKNEIDLHLDDVDGMLTKEVYARFGLAYYLTECLHRGLCNYYVFATYKNKSDITGPRTEEKLAFSFLWTMGRLYNELEALLPPKMELSPKIKHVLDRRNYLAHRFWFEQVHLMTSNSGLLKMVAELSQLVTEFEELDKEVEILVGEQIERLDVDEQIFITAFEEVLAGKPWESFLQRRELKKEERITIIWDVPTNKGLALIFQTQDGCLWELCDVGLGWTKYERPESNWTINQKLVGFLPSNIKPRPVTKAPWHFSFYLSNDAILWIQKGDRDRTFKWGIRTKP